MVLSISTFTDTLNKTLLFIAHRFTNLVFHHFSPFISLYYVLTFCGRQKFVAFLTKAYSQLLNQDLVDRLAATTNTHLFLVFRIILKHLPEEGILILGSCKVSQEYNVTFLPFLGTTICTLSKK